MGESLGEHERLWEHKLQVSVSTAFSSSQKLSQVFFITLSEIQRRVFCFF